MTIISVDEYKQIAKPGLRKGQPRPGWEQQFADQLEAERLAGHILWWAYEPIAIVLTHGGGGVKGMRYEPDFVVVDQWHMTLVYEVKRPKGRGRQLGINKLKMAADKMPHWQFYLVDKVAGEWRIKHYGGR